MVSITIFIDHITIAKIGISLDKPYNDLFIKNLVSCPRQTTSVVYLKPVQSDQSQNPFWQLLLIIHNFVKIVNNRNGVKMYKTLFELSNRVPYN